MITLLDTVAQPNAAGAEGITGLTVPAGTKLLVLAAAIRASSASVAPKYDGALFSFVAAETTETCQLRIYELANPTTEEANNLLLALSQESVNVAGVWCIGADGVPRVRTSSIVTAKGLTEPRDVDPDPGLLEITVESAADELVLCAAAVRRRPTMTPTAHASDDWSEFGDAEKATDSVKCAGASAAGSSQVDFSWTIEAGGPTQHFCGIGLAIQEAGGDGGSLFGEFSAGFATLSWALSSGVLYRIVRADVVAGVVGKYGPVGMFDPSRETLPWRDVTGETGRTYSYFVIPEIDGEPGSPIGPVEIEVRARPGHVYTQLRIYAYDPETQTVGALLYDSGQIPATEGPLAATGLPSKTWVIPSLRYSDGTRWSQEGFGTPVRTRNGRPAAPSSCTAAGSTTTTAQIVGGAYSDPDGDPHTYSQYQVRTAEGEIVYDSGQVAPVVGSHTASGLPPNTSGLKARVRYSDGESWSDWKESEAFATGNRRPNTPASCTVTEVGATSAQITGSAYSDPDSDAHAYSQFRVLSSSGEVLYDSGQVAATLVHTASGLPGDTAGLVPQVRYSDSKAWSEYRSGAAFATGNRKPNTPSSCSVDLIHPTSVRIIGSAFSDPDAGSRHVYSQFRVRNGETVLYDSGQVAATLLRGATGLPADTSGLVAEVRYSDGKAWSDYKESSTFATPAEPVTPTLPSYDVEIGPEDDVAAIVAGAAEGTVFRILPGTYRQLSLTPKNGQTFLFEDGAVMNGAKLLTTWTKESGRWYTTGQTAIGGESFTHGSCAAGTPRCNRAEELFVDGVRWKHVASISQVTAGTQTWYFDYGTGRVWVGDNLTGHTVELSATSYAFSGSASNVVIARYGNSGGGIIEKYGPRAQRGAIEAGSMVGLLLEYMTVRLNHGYGVRISDNAIIHDCKLLRNGQLGIGGSGDDIQILYNEIAYNNEAGFSTSWEAGGLKLVRCNDLVLRGNLVHHNTGPGLWCDIDNLRTLYEYNRVEDNTGPGIFHEISYDAVIRFNEVRRNGFGFQTWLWGAGILVAGSPNVEIARNVLELNADGIGAIQQNRGAGAHGPYRVRNLYVHDNEVVMGVGTSGMVRDDGDNGIFDPLINRWNHNAYRVDTSVKSLAASWFDLEKGKSFQAWQQAGFDVDGTFEAL